MEQFTIGEIFRKKLLLNHRGKPYTSQGTISKILSNEPHVIQKTAFGNAKLFSRKTIDSLNKRWN